MTPEANNPPAPPSLPVSEVGVVAWMLPNGDDAITADDKALDINSANPELVALSAKYTVGLVLASERDALAERLRGVTEWQPIETAPKDGSWIIVAHFGEWPSDYMPFELFQWREDHDSRIVSVTDLGGMTETKLEHTNNGEFYWHGGSNFHRATHWLPAPAPLPPLEAP